MSASGLETDKDLWATKVVAHKDRMTEQMKRDAFTAWIKTRPTLRSKSDMRKSLTLRSLVKILVEIGLEAFPYGLRS